jgi:outer membrane protein OmpA-like peptidoglycan-associated protein
VTSHGEATLLVPTADNVNEPRNRRVDITVR